MMSEPHAEPYGKTILVHESTIYELQMAFRARDYETAGEIIERLAAIEEREQLRAIRNECYKRMRARLAKGDRKTAKVDRENMRKAAEVLKDYAI